MKDKMKQALKDGTSGNGVVRRIKIFIKILISIALIVTTLYLCAHFMTYQRNAMNQVNKYRINQACMVVDGDVAEQVFVAKHRHLKSVRIYFGNDYAALSKGKVLLSVVDEKSGIVLSRIKKAIKKIPNYDYAEFHTDLQLIKRRRYILRITTKGAEPGQGPLLFNWRTKERGFSGHLMYNQQDMEKYTVAKLYYPVIIYRQWAGLILSMLFILFLLWFKIPLPDPVTRVMGYILFFVAPVFTFWIVERFTDNPLRGVRAPEFALNIILYYMFFSLLYVIFNSKRWTVGVGMLFWYIAGLANFYVLTFKGSPIVPSDMMSASTGFSVAKNYTFFIQPVFIWNAFFVMMFTVLIWRCPSQRTKGWILRTSILVTVIILSMVMAHYVVEQKTLKSFGIKNNVWDQKKGYAKNGFFFGFVLNMNSLIQDKPDKYSADAAKDIAHKFEEIYANRSGKKKKKGRLETPDGTAPNIIAIMNEAYSDLHVVGEFSTNKDYMPYFHSLKKNTIKGSLYMSIFGSGTCNSEFEFLTGNTMAFLQSGIIAYTQIVDDTLPNITYNLKDQGYGGNLALHPYLATGWNRPKVYEYMGFDTFYSQDAFIKPLMIRKYISDQSDFEKIEELYENRTDRDKPFYLFNVTMQNHGGFDKVYPNFKNNILITDSHKSEQAEQYLSLVKKTDEALEGLVKYFSKVEEPTLIIMFGDHQPSVESIFYDGLLGNRNWKGENIFLKYQTPFIIWANYDIREATIGKMSANYLSAYVMKEAGLKISPYQQFLLDLRKDLPVLTAMGCLDKKGKYYESALDTPYADMVKEYQIMQYNNLIDTKHTVHSFFYVDKE